MPASDSGATPPPLDPASLRAFARRDWGRNEAETRRRRAAESVDVRISIGISLYDSVRAARADWPTTADRRADLEHHLRMRALLDEAATARAR